MSRRGSAGKTGRADPTALNELEYRFVELHHDVVGLAVAPPSRGWLARQEAAEQQHRQERQLATAMAELTVANLAGLDLKMRWWVGWSPSERIELSEADASRLLAEAHEKLAMAAGLSMNRNGHVRELAVRALSRLDDARVVPWLTLRTGDWVAEVRRSATEALTPWLSSEHATALIAILPLLQGGRFTRSAEGERAAAAILDVLRRPDARPALLAHLGDPHPVIRRACTSLACQSGDPFGVLGLVMGLGDVVSTGLTLRHLPPDGPDNARVGRALLASPEGRFRAEGLWRLLRDLPPGSAEAATLRRRGLTDRATSVRDVAQRAARASGEDPGQYYRTLLADSPAAALTGLGDLTTPAADDRLAALGLLNDPAPSVRAAALRLLARADRPEDRPHFIRSLFRGSARERREAVAGLRRGGLAEPLLNQLVADALALPEAAALRSVLFQLVPAANCWTRLAVGLSAVAPAAPAAPVGRAEEARRLGLEVIRRALHAWNHTAYRTAGIDLADLRRAFDAARPALAGEPLTNRGRQLLIPTIENLLASATFGDRRASPGRGTGHSR